MNLMSSFGWICFGLITGLLCAQSSDSGEGPAEDSLRTMMLTSKAVRAAVESFQPSLVTIESFGGMSAVQGRIGGIRKQGEGNTTGVIVSPDGHIVTSTFNFIQRPPVITVITHDGVRHVAELLGRDDTRKICMLKINAGRMFRPPPMIATEQVTVGQWAISIGVGYGDVNPAASVGIISAKDRVGGRAIQTDANISPANYGGPLLDIKGRMLGICVPMNPQSQAIGAGVEWYDSGIGFAIPLAGSEELLKRLQQGEQIAPAFLGVRAMQNPNGKGVWIEQVVPGSPADESGISKKDVIIQINQEKIQDMMQLKKVLNRFEAGTRIDMTFTSGETGQSKKIQLKLGRVPTPEGETKPLEVPKIR
ncbi:MAG: S1C family serine protease [Mariniblastus sp.]|nr:S1C family serine protease [Mariniblastus sp.]